MPAPESEPDPLDTPASGQAAEEPSARSDYLLISRVGRESLYREWLAPGDERTYDVLLSAYHADVRPPREAGVWAEYRPGPKVAGYAGILKDHRDFVFSHRYIALLDDDLSVDATGLDRMFALCDRHRLRIGQPALTRDSHFTYAALLRDPCFELRHVNFIEMMCPVFRADALEEAAFLFDLGFESGIDLVWCNLGEPTPEAFAVIDAVPVRHARPVAGDAAGNGFGPGRRYEDDISRVLEIFALPWLRCVPRGGVTTTGRRVRGRAPMLLSALSLFPSAIAMPPRIARVRAVATYIKHLLQGPQGTVRIRSRTGGHP